MPATGLMKIPFSSGVVVDITWRTATLLVSGIIGINLTEGGGEILLGRGRGQEGRGGRDRRDGLGKGSREGVDALNLLTKGMRACLVGISIWREGLWVE